MLVNLKQRKFSLFHGSTGHKLHSLAGIHIHRVPKLATLLQISWCKIVNTGQIFTKCKTLVKTIILN